MKKFFSFAATCLVTANIFSQSIGIGTNSPDNSAHLEIAHNGKGLLIPRTYTNAIITMTNPARGLMLYDTIKNQLMVNMGNSLNPSWQTIDFKSSWCLSGNSNPIGFLGTTDTSPLHFRVNNQRAGILNSSTLASTSFGYQAGLSGQSNTAFGYQALTSTTQGYNTAVGAYALFSNNLGTSNTAVGHYSLYANLNSIDNVAVGRFTLTENISGSYNTACGVYALFNNDDSYNTAFGYQSLYATSNAQYNVGVGYRSGDSYDNGYNNVFVGANTDVNSAGLFNVIAVGQATVVTSGSSTARFGNAATTSYGGWAGWSNISDGRYKQNVRENVPGIEFIKRLRPVTYNLLATELDAFLHKIEKDEISGEARQLHAKALIDKEKITYTGFVAQEVETAAKQLGFEFSGIDPAKNENDTYGLHYAEFVVPIVKAMQEQQQMIEDLQKQNMELLKTNTAQKKLVDELLKRIEKLESSLVLKK